MSSSRRLSSTAGTMMTGVESRMGTADLIQDDASAASPFYDHTQSFVSATSALNDHSDGKKKTPGPRAAISISSSPFRPGYNQKNMDDGNMLFLKYFSCIISR